jgi:WD40 repeat protein
MLRQSTYAYYLKVQLAILLFLLFFYGGLLGQDQKIRLGLPVGHTEKLNSAVFSPDGKLVATSSEDETAKIWDTHSGKVIFTLIPNKSEGVSNAAFSSDG